MTSPAVATSPRIAPSSASRRRATRVQRVAIPYTMLAPAIVLFVLFMAAPILYTVVLSFQTVRVSGLGLGAADKKLIFAGLDNYISALSDPQFVASVVRVLAYGAILIPVMLGLALVFALLLDSRRSRATKFSRVAIFLPYAVPAVISSLLWGFLYLPGISPVVYILNALHISAPNILEPNLVIFAIANIALWGGVGFNMIVIYTALRAIPSDIYEAARIDGATESQIAWRIKVPIILPSLIMTGLFSIIATLQVFSEPTTLRPLTNSLSTSWTPLMKVYRDAFIRNDIYSAAATSVVIALGTFALSFVFLRIVQRRAFGQEDS